jgi:hypothetical protein
VLPQNATICHSARPLFVDETDEHRARASVLSPSRSGTAVARPAGRPDHGRSQFLQREEIPIRTLSVSLLAVAAFAASLLISRSRQEKAGDMAHSDQLPVEQSLDAIRAAGL